MKFEALWRNLRF